MKTKITHIALFTLLTISQVFAQDVTTVRANNSDISDNLDLKAVASVFGDSRDLEDFERRLNDPELQLSNLDLNGDNRVDYLRVIEATENNTHVIIIQSVLGEDVFQDIATIEVEKGRGNNVQVQVVGDVYMYGPNYIYEPIYVSRPVIYDVFWASSYRPYYSPWYWGYYPTYYTYWSPYPVYRYRNHVHNHINTRNTYAYSNSRRSSRAEALYNTRRANGYERQHPNTSFNSRTNVTNRYALEQTRANSRTQNAGNATRSSFNNASSRTNNATRNTNNTVRNSADVNTPSRSNSQSVRNVYTPARSSNEAVRTSPAVQPSRNTNVTPAPSINNSTMAPARQSAPVMRSAPAPAMRSAPTPAPSRQSAPAPSRSGGNAGSSRSSRG